ncbi:MAG: cytochrome c-type biogenesis protein CcmH [Candidatus Nitronauta litoralis]|uniref:Cytochrome c-type biogenesis protein n=1 Tax=Candidatus Nitronauta litoralis TaxID=2705533 RepID=A0A7T0FZ13_9BACT|nr:MAG: cytochrome c-type biogenesis protein CcmH [Candidatus Nitronauta litoralis]
MTSLAAKNFLNANRPVYFKQIAQILLMSIVLALAVVPAMAASQMDNLENELMCNCKDECGKVLINCTCDHSKKMRKELKAQLDSGLTVKQIVQAYVNEYGETILSAPTKSGFNLSAWVTPFIALVIGGVGVRTVMRKWIKPADKQSGKSAVASSGADEASTTGSTDNDEPSSEYSSRVKRELDNLED